MHPGICDNLDTDHSSLISLYKKARALPGIRKVLIASGVRYDLAVESPEYVRELVTEHVGGYLKIAPEHTERDPLRLMLKPGIGTYDRFKELFDRYSAQAGKEQYLIPYFIAAHPGTRDEDMLELALWLKRNGYRADQVQAFLPSPMASATTMYHTQRNPYRKVTRDQDAEQVHIPKAAGTRRLHKAFLRWHDANNWPMLRAALQRMGRADLIGNGKHHLIPTYQPKGTGGSAEGRRRKGTNVARTQHAFAYKDGGNPHAADGNSPSASATNQAEPVANRTESVAPVRPKRVPPARSNQPSEAEQAPRPSFTLNGVAWMSDQRDPVYFVDGGHSAGLPPSGKARRGAPTVRWIALRAFLFRLTRAPRNSAVSTKRFATRTRVALRIDGRQGEANVGGLPL